MKNFITRNENFSKIEFWGVTALFIFLVFFHISHALTGGFLETSSTPAAQRAPFTFNFVSSLIRYVILYSAFLILNFIIVPRLLRKESILVNVLSIVIIYVLVALIFGFTDSYLKSAFIAGQDTSAVAFNIIFQKSFLFSVWLLLVFGFYTVIRYASIYLLSNSESIQAKYKIITPVILVAFIAWMIIMFILLAFGGDKIMNTVWAIVIPSAIALYTFAFNYLIPQALHKKRPFLSYLTKTLLVLLFSSFIIFAFATIFSDSEDTGGAISFFNAFFQLCITTPFTWFLFKRHAKGNEELLSLKKELGKSNANFDFLRSQINPHFLFNALNTIYGTAIQENAERTSEGIERLGDMMRFMLQENMQDKIALSREIDYLNNYIILQKLRTDPNPSIRIEAEIEKHFAPVQIAPMLLIPFIENAFKHGISFREPSYIKANLEVKNNILYFDVSNSKHEKKENDPEKDKSGIGLMNVEQRLKAFYPKKHELVLRETKKDFFVHLTLNLS